MKSIVAIHQPNFLPWLGFFHKWLHSDMFVWLDEVQMVRRTYLSRTTILEQEKTGKVSIPISHTGTQALSVMDARIDPTQWKPEKLFKRLQFAYGKQSHWNSLHTQLETILCTQKHETLLCLNKELLYWIGGDLLGLDTHKIRFQSELNTTQTKSALMAEITSLVGGNIYLSGGKDPDCHEGPAVGAASYNHIEDFTQRGLAIRYQNFSPKPYNQGDRAFVPGLSILDPLAHLGPSETRKHLLSYGSDLA